MAVNDVLAVAAGLAFFILLIVGVLFWALLPKVRKIYALVNTAGEVIEYQRPPIERGFVLLGEGKYHINRRFFRDRIRFVFFGLMTRVDRIIFFTEPLKEPHNFFEPTENFKAQLQEENAWALRTFSDARKADAMYENVPQRFPIAWVVAILAVVAVIVVAVSKFR